MRILQTEQFDPPIYIEFTKKEALWLIGMLRRIYGDGEIRIFANTLLQEIELNYNLSYDQIDEIDSIFGGRIEIHT